MKLSLLLAMVFVLPLMLRAEGDILDYTAEHPRRNCWFTDASGTLKRYKYGDPELEAAENTLSSRYPRPWAVHTAIDWFNEATDDDTKEALIRVLAASRDAKAALCLASARICNGNSGRIRASAYSALNDYFLTAQEQYNGREAQLEACVDKWFAANEARLRNESKE